MKKIKKKKKKPCHVVYTDYRPTPLQHYIFPAGGDGIYLVIDERGKLREENFQKALVFFSFFFFFSLLFLLLFLFPNDKNKSLQLLKEEEKTKE